MPNTANKVKYGLKNVHYALVYESVNTSGEPVSTYGDVKSWPGAVNLSLSSSASKTVFRADDSDYFVTYGQGGYEGDLESALVPEDIKTAVLGFQTDDDGILVESTGSFSTNKYIAMMFEFDGDQRQTKHCLYKVSLSRPSIASQTTGENGQIDPQTETLTLTAGPRCDADHYIHAETATNTDAEATAAWYTAVPVPTFTPSP